MPELENKRTAPEGCAPLTCSACGRSDRRSADYGDFSEFEVRWLVAQYCTSLTLGLTGWGVPFKVWVELHGYAKYEGHHRLSRLPNAKNEADHTPKP